MSQKNTNEITRIREVYNTIYRPEPTNHTYTWHPSNRVSIYYRQAQERALVALFNTHNIPLGELTVLDVGCGKGNLLRYLLSLGAHPEHLFGVDLMPYRIADARLNSPNSMHFSIGNGQALPYPAAWFDLVSQFTVFSSIFDPEMQRQIATEMTRVLKPGGYILWYDMRYARSATTRGIERTTLESLFADCVLLTLHKLHPPFASALARRSHFLTELWTSIPGPRKTHYLALFKKPSL